MEGFSVKISGFDQGIAEEEALIKQLKNLETEIESVKTRVDFQVKGRAGVMNSFNSINAEMERHISVWNSMKDSLGNISGMYQSTEKKNSAISNGQLFGSIIGNLGESIGSIVGAGAWTPGNGDLFGGGGGGGRLPGNASLLGAGAEIFENGPFAGTKVFKDNVEMGIAGLGSIGISGSEIKFRKGDTSVGIGLSSENIIDDIKFKKNLFKDKGKRDEKGVKGEYKDGKWVIKTYEEEQNEKKGAGTKEEENEGGKIGKKILENTTIASWKEDFISSTLWEGGFENENASGSLSVSDFNVNGKALLTATGAEVGVGIGYTLLQGNLEGRIGDENLGVHASGNIAIGKAEAKAGVKATVLDENGNLALNLGASASAEAILAEANVKAGVNLAGADVSAVAGVNFGVGAHADVGFYDGKFKFDVGASMGLGFSVDLEIDVSKPLEKLANIGNGAADLWNEGKKMFSNWFG